MRKDKKPYNILVIEDNPGDFILIQDFLEEWIVDPTVLRAKNFKEAKKIFSSTKFKCHCILLDLTLPDKSGEMLIREVIGKSSDIPIIILTGFDNFPFAIKSLSLGVSDYLLKEELTSSYLYKSIIYSIEKKKTLIKLQASEDRYSKLFHFSPLPMWLYDIDTFAFLDVNKAAMKFYGYTYEEFKSLTVKDIRPPEEIYLLMEANKKSKKNKNKAFKGIFTHQKKNKDLVKVEVFSILMDTIDSNVRLVLANDITDKLSRIESIERQNQKLKEIAWMESHIVRAPLARILGLIDLIDNDLISETEKSEALQHIKESTHEMDVMVREVIKKAEQLVLDN